MNIQQTTNRHRQKSNLLHLDVVSQSHHWYNQHDMTRSVCCTKMRALIKQLDSHACDDLIDSSSTLIQPVLTNCCPDAFRIMSSTSWSLCVRAIEDSPNHSCSLDPARDASQPSSTNKGISTKHKAFGGIAKSYRNSRTVHEELDEDKRRADQAWRCPLINQSLLLLAERIFTRGTPAKWYGEIFRFKEGWGRVVDFSTTDCWW